MNKALFLKFISDSSDNQIDRVGDFVFDLFSQSKEEQVLRYSSFLSGEIELIKKEKELLSPSKEVAPVVE